MSYLPIISESQAVLTACLVEVDRCLVCGRVRRDIEIFQGRANRMSPKMNKRKCTVSVAFVTSVFLYPCFPSRCKALFLELKHTFKMVRNKHQEDSNHG